jgi:uncharacterized protein (TIGR03067 family)
MNAWDSLQPSLPSDDLDRQIDEELMFHLRALVEEFQAQGLSTDEAWRQAQARFGSFRRHAAACQRESHILWRSIKWFATGALALVAVAIALLWIEARHSRQAAVALLAQVQAQAAHASRVQEQQAEPAAGALADFSGTLRDDQAHPIAGASILVIRKTWPGGRYRQEDFQATSDEQGHFRLAQFVPTQGQFAIQVAALKPGYAFASHYTLVEEHQSHELEPLQLQLGSATPLQLTLRDRTGHPIAGAIVTPHSRQTGSAPEQLVYLQGSEPIQLRTDANGAVTLHCFQPGDHAGLHLQLLEGDYHQITFDVPPADQPQQLELVVQEVAGATPLTEAEPQATREPSPAEQPLAVQPADPRLLGTWIIVAAVSEGHASSAEHLAETQVGWDITPATITMHWQKKRAGSPDTVKEMENTWTYSVDPSQSPAWFDQQINGSKTTLGIYEIADDTLRICTSDHHQPDQRPTRFESVAGTPNSTLWVFKRATSIVDAKFQSTPETGP